MPYRIKITNQQFEADIEGTQDWSRSVTRDFNDRIFRTRGEYRFVGHEGLYNLLYNHVSLGGVCEALEGRIYFNTGSGWDYEWKGDILPQDQEFDLLGRNVDGQVLDSSWASKFNNAQEQKVFMKGQTSKRGNTIPSAVSQLCDFFTPTTGAYDVTNRECYRVYDVFTYLVDYYSDSTVTFTSTFFDTGGDGEQWYITTGKEIRTGDQNSNPELSFDELFDEMSKKLNLWIIIEGTQDNPILRVEPQDYCFDEQLLLTIEDPENLTMKIDLDQLYTIIKVGGTNSIDYDGSDYNYPTIRFRAWNDEQYNTPGDCEFENNTLNLVSSWRIDSNSFEGIIIGGSDEFDDDIFIIEIDPSTQNCYQFTTDFTGAGTIEYIYNFNLTNQQVLTAWFNGIPQEIVDDVGGDNYNVFVNSPNPSSINPAPPTQSEYDLIYDNDSVAPATDVDDIYTTTGETGGGDQAGQFKSPQDALYTVSGATTVTVTEAASQAIRYRMVGLVYEDNTQNTLLRTIEYQRTDFIGFNYPSLPNTATMYVDDEIFLGEGNVLRFEIRRVGARPVNPPKFTINSAYMELTTTAAQNLTTAPDNPLIYIYEAQQFKLSRTDFNTLDQGGGFVRILDTNGNKNYDVWVKDVKYNSTTGVVEVGEFIGGIPPTQVCWVLETGFWNDECWWLDEELLVEDESDWFIITVDTTVAGKTNNDQFEFPLVGSANLLIDWGDGQIETGVTSTTTHTYGSTGTYTIKATGTWTRFAFLTTTEDNDKVQTIEQWGDIGWGSMANAFFHCGNLTANYTDQPNVSNCSNFQQAFRQCTNFNGNVGGFDMSSATSLVNMFLNCTSFNNGGLDSIKDWSFNSVSGNIAMAGTFSGCTAFNQPLTNWSTNRVTSFSQFMYNCTNFDQPLGHFRFDICTTIFWMLRNCSSFDQNVGNWNMDTRPVGTYTNMMQGVTLSTANYDATLTGWLGWSGGAPTKTLPANRTNVHFGGSTYSLGSDAADARNYLITTLSWGLTDGGGV